MSTMLCVWLSLVLATAFAFGADALGSDNPLERHLATGPSRSVLSGATVSSAGVFEIALRPIPEIGYPLRLKDRAVPSYGGRVTFDNLPIGHYAIVLSHKAELEVIQQSATAFQGNGDAGLGPTTIMVNGGPITLELRAVATPTITMAVFSLPH